MNKRDAVRLKSGSRIPKPQGLIGLFGHTHVLDDGRKVIQCQFEIVRQMDDDRYIVQLFSYLDGSPTQVKVMNEAELLGPDVSLYLTAEDMRTAYDKEARYYERKWKRELDRILSADDQGTTEAVM